MAAKRPHPDDDEVMEFHEMGLDDRILGVRLGLGALKVKLKVKPKSKVKLKVKLKVTDSLKY